MKVKRIIEIEESDLERIREIVERENKTALSVTTRGTAYMVIADSKLYDEAEVWKKSNELLKKRLRYLGDPTCDLISREALKKAVEEQRKPKVYSDADERQNIIVDCILYIIDKAPPVEAFTKEDMAGAYNEGYACGSRENTRPQDECVDISKLRLMTVEECAGHTIDYAMGWKACIEWIKRGGAE